MNPLRKFYLRLRLRIRTRASFAALKARRGIPLTAREKALLFFVDLRGWQEARFTVASRAQANARRRICEAHPCWQRTPTPHCGVCGCSPVKFYLASSRCPRGHW